MAEDLLGTARAVAAGIDGDPELRLDVQAETAAWLEAAAAGAAAEGLPAEACAARAVAALGNVRDRRRELAALMEPRRRRRAAARTWGVWLSFLAVALAFLLAPLGISGWPYHSGSPQAFYLINFWTRYSSAFQASRQPASAWTRDAREWRTLWQSQPDNTAYLGYYAGWHRWSNSAPIPTADLSAYRQRDPANAHPYYLLAMQESNAAFTEIEKLSYDPDPAAVVKEKLRVRDRARLDRAMRLLREGMAHPRLRRYADVITHDRLRLLPAPTRFDTYIVRREVGYAISPRETDRVLLPAAYYARLLVREGRAREALPYLRFWRVYCRQDLPAARDDYALESLRRLALTGAKLSALVYREMGREDLAQREEADAQHFQTATALPPSYYEIGSQDGRIVREGGMLAVSALDPFSGDAATPVTSAELSVARQVEYLLREQRALATFLMVTAMLLIGLGLLQSLWSLAGLGSATPAMRLLPPALLWALALGLGTLLPLAGYWWFTRYTGWAGRATPVDALGYLFTAQVALPLLLCLLAPFLIAAGWVRRRWRALGLPVPSWPRTLGSGIFILLAVSCVYGGSSELLRGYNNALAGIWFALAIVLVGAALRRTDARLWCLWLGALLLAACIPMALYWDVSYATPSMIFLALVTLYAQLEWRITLLACGVFSLAQLIGYIYSGWSFFDQFLFSDLLSLVLIIAFVVLAPVLFTIRLARRRAFAPDPVDLRQAAYQASLLRTVLPVLAASVLLVLLLAGSYLVTQEIRWLRRDTVLVPKGLEVYSPAYLRAFGAVKARGEAVVEGWRIENVR